MRVGVGLPTTTPGADGALLVDWARKADAGPFSSLGVLDRLLYDSFDPFASLAAAAAVTRADRAGDDGGDRPAAARRDAGQGGRVGAGALRRPAHARARDRRARRRLRGGGVPHQGRGARLSDQLAELRDWDVSPVVPGAVTRPAAGAARGRQQRRRVRPHGPLRRRLRARRRPAARVRERRRQGAAPRGATSAARASRALWGQAYFALGDEAAGEAYLLDYYAFTGPFAAKIAAGNLTSPRAIRDFVRAYEEAGCDELVLLPTVADLGQLDRLADVLA